MKLRIWMAALALVALFPLVGAAQGAPPPDLPDYQLSDVDVPPQPLNLPRLQKALMENYPQEMREAGVSGQVQLRFRILENGRVDASSITVSRTSDGRFDAAAKKSIEELRFRPARVNGRPARVWVEQPIQFHVSA